MKNNIFTIFMLSLSTQIYALTFVDGKQVNPDLDKINKLEITNKAILFELESLKSSNLDLLSINKSLFQENNTLNKNISDLNVQFKKTAATSETKSNNIAILNSEISNLHNKNNNLSVKNDQINLKLNNSNEKYSNLFKKFNILNGNYKKLSEINNSLNEAKASLIIDKKNLSTSNTKLKEQATKDTGTIASEAIKLQDELTNYIKINDKLSKQLNNVNSNNDTQLSKISELKAQIKRQKVLMSKNNDEKSIQLLKDVNSLQNNINILKKTNANLTSSISKLKSANQDIDNKLIQVNIKNDALLADNERLNAEVQYMGKENEELVDSQYLFSSVNYYLIFTTLFGIIFGVIVSIFFARFSKQKRDSFYHIDRSY
jgi:chromosome segregation ATPase